MFTCKAIPLLLFLIQNFHLDFTYCQNTTTSPTSLSQSDDHHAILELPMIRPLRRRGRGRGQTLISYRLMQRRREQEANGTTTSTPAPQSTPTPTSTGDTDPTYPSVGMTRSKLPIGTGTNESIFAAVILPYSMFHKRDYLRAINMGMRVLESEPEFEELFARHFSGGPEDHLLLRMMKIDPNPEDTLKTFCQEILHSNVSAIIYLKNQENYGSCTAASKYFLQLAHNAGLPVIAWNADNSGLHAKASQSSTDMVLQLAPSIHHQAAAMLSILARYNWHQFAIVTSQIAGHDDFVQAVRDQVRESQFKFDILANVVVLEEKDLVPLVESEARIFLLYCTKKEAKGIMEFCNPVWSNGIKELCLDRDAVRDWAQVG